MLLKYLENCPICDSKNTVIVEEPYKGENLIFIRCNDCKHEFGNWDLIQVNIKNRTKEKL